MTPRIGQWGLVVTNYQVVRRALRTVSELKDFDVADASNAIEIAAPSADGRGRCGAIS